MSEELLISPNAEETNSSLKILIDSVCKYFSIDKPSPKQGAPAKASEADLVVVIKAMSLMMEKLRKEKDETIRELKSEVDMLNGRIKNLENLSGSCTEKETNKETIKPLFSEILSRPTKNEINIIAKFEREQNEMKSREKNIIMFGLELATGKESEKVKEIDLDKVRGIFNELEVNDVQIRQVRRLNSKNEGKPGPIIVELKESKERWRVLKEAKKLRNSEKFSKVFIAADLTLTQREVQRELLNERKRKNEQLIKDNGGQTGDFFYGIRNNKVVRIQK